MTKCRICGQPLDEFGWCLSHDAKSITESRPGVEAPEGFDPEVFLKASSRTLTLHQARVGRLVFVEPFGHSQRLYPLTSAVILKFKPKGT